MMIAKIVSVLVICALGANSQHYHDHHHGYHHGHHGHHDHHHHHPVVAPIPRPLIARAPLLAAPPRAVIAEPHYPPTPYSFGYQAPVYDGAITRQEQGDGNGHVTGSYTIQSADGQHRVVNYVADEHGFRATITTNEPGTESRDPADAHIESSAIPGAEAAYAAEQHHGHHGHHAPAPVHVHPAPAPVHVHPAPAPVHVHPAPAPVLVRQAPVHLHAHAAPLAHHHHAHAVAPSYFRIGVAHDHHHHHAPAPYHHHDPHHYEGHHHDHHHGYHHARASAPRPVAVAAPALFGARFRSA